MIRITAKLSRHQVDKNTNLGDTHGCTCHPAENTPQIGFVFDNAVWDTLFSAQGRKEENLQRIHLNNT